MNQPRPAQPSELRAAAEHAAALSEARSQIARLEAEVSRLETMVWTDPLTGLANRRHVDHRLPQLFAEALRYATELTCIMIDLDGFKSINDTLGHVRGDELLQLTGRIISDEVRSADVAARYGGDEFLVLMPQTSIMVAAGVAARLSHSFHLHAAQSARMGIRCGMSIGLACMGVSQPLNAPELIAHADNALYAAKQAGKNRIMLCGQDGVNAAQWEEAVV